MGLAEALGDREAFGRDAANTPDLELGQQTKNGRGRGRVLEGAVGEKKKKKKIKKIMATIRCWWTYGLYLALICFALFSSFFFFFLLLLLFLRLYLLAFVRGPVTALSFGLVILRSSLGYTFSAFSR